MIKNELIIKRRLNWYDFLNGSVIRKRKVWEKIVFPQNVDKLSFIGFKDLKNQMKNIFSNKIYSNNFNKRYIQ